MGFFLVRSCGLIIPFKIMHHQAPLQSLSTLRSQMWTTGRPIPLNAKDSSSSPSLAWWKRTLRDEYFRICLSNTSLTYTHPPSTTEVGTLLLPPPQKASGFKIPADTLKSEDTTKPDLELSMHSVSGKIAVCAFVFISNGLNGCRALHLLPPD